jgi:hypothetical protein
MSASMRQARVTGRQAGDRVEDRALVVELWTELKSKVMAPLAVGEAGARHIGRCGPI